MEAEGDRKVREGGGEVCGFIRGGCGRNRMRPSMEGPGKEGPAPSGPGLKAPYDAPTRAAG